MACDSCACETSRLRQSMDQALASQKIIDNQAITVMIHTQIVIMIAFTLVMGVYK